MTVEEGDAVGQSDKDDLVLEVVVHRSPESGLHTAHVRSLRPMVVKAYALAEVFKSIWDALAAQDALGRFAGDVVIECKYRYLREDNDRLDAEASEFASALARIMDPDHPAGSVATLVEARELARAAFGNATRAGRGRRRAWRSGALAQTGSSADADLLQALCAAVDAVLPLLAEDGVPSPNEADPLWAVLGQLRVVRAACDNKSLNLLRPAMLSGIVASQE